MVAISRSIALSVLNRLDSSSDTFPDSLLHEAFEREQQISGKDRALATELVYGVLRWKGRLDWVLCKLSKIPIDKIDPPILNTIRVGLYQILFLSRIPHSAAVNDSVEMTKGMAPQWVTGFVNGVLRSATREAKELSLPDLGDDPAHAIAIEESHPLWLVKKWVELFGIDEARQLCKANNLTPPVTVRTNTLRITRQELLSALKEHVKQISPARYAPEGLVIRGMGRSVEDIPLFRDGFFQIQDEAAQLISHLLDPQPGETILDACAGLGGKTGHIAQLMEDRGMISAMEKHAWKLDKLKTSLGQLGISSVGTWLHDLSEPAPAGFHESFDRILLDAPCSGLGVLRRNPDAKWRKKKSDPARLQVEQLSFLKAVSPLLKPGGRMVYCVCSLEPEEGEAVVKSFLRDLDEFVVDQERMRLKDVHGQMFDSTGFFKSLPHKHDMDGFFAVRLKKTVKSKH